MDNIEFNEIPENIRTPGSFIEFDGTQSAVASQDLKKVMFGQRLVAGSVAADIATRVTRKGDGATFFGDNSYLAQMCDAALAADESIELWVYAQDDNGAGAAAAGTITIDTAPTAAGTLNVYIAGVRIQVAVGSTDVVGDVATALAAAINANKVVPVSAAVVAAVVTVTARHKGELGNDLDIRFNYAGEAMPASLTATIVAMAGGTSNPDLTNTIAAMGDEWYNWYTNPYTDAANLTLLEAELDSRWGPLRQIDGRALMAVKGTLAETSTFGNGENSKHFSTMGTNDSPTPTYIWAAVNCAIAAKYLAINPVRPLQTLELPGVLPPVREARWIQSERNIHLWDGISTYKVDQSGKVRIEHQVTMYQTNPGGFNDETWLDFNDPEFDSRFRYAQRALIAKTWPRASLASDGESVPAGMTVVTPDSFTVKMLGLYREWVEKGWAEKYDDYKAGFVAIRDISDNDRLNWRDRPNRVNQARVFAGKMQVID